jgi:hypothetical protein
MDDLSARLESLFRRYAAALGQRQSGSKRWDHGKGALVIDRLAIDAKTTKAGLVPL